MLIGAWARSLRRYLFDRIEKKGTTLLLNRFELMLAIVLALALMTAMAYFPEPWYPHSRYKYLAVAVIIIGILAFTKNRRVILGVALALVTLRLAIGVLLLGGRHFLFSLGLTIVCGTLAWLLLKDYR